MGDFNIPNVVRGDFSKIKFDIPEAGGEGSSKAELKFIHAFVKQIKTDTSEEALREFYNSNVKSFIDLSKKEVSDDKVDSDDENIPEIKKGGYAVDPEGNRVEIEIGLYLNLDDTKRLIQEVHEVYKGTSNKEWGALPDILPDKESDALPDKKSDALPDKESDALPDIPDID